MRKMPDPLILATVVLAATALAGPSVRVGTQGRFRALVFDNSESFRPGRRELEKFVSACTADLGQNDRWVLWTFGKAPLVLAGPFRGGTKVETPPLSVAGSASFLGEALRAVVMTEDPPSEIVLYTDGRATDEGEGLDISVPVYPVLPESPDAIDVRISTADAPAHVLAGQPFSLEAGITANRPCRADVTILRDGSELDSRTVSVPPSGYLLRFRDALKSEGPHTYAVTVSLDGDGYPGNNRWEVPVHVGGTRPILILSRFGAESALYTILKRSPGFFPRVVRPADAAGGAAIAGCAVLVLEGVGADELPHETASRIVEFVRNGGGLLVLPTGPNVDMSDHGEEPLGEILPVDFKDKDTRHMVIALDRSGSMAQRAGSSIKIEMAKQAVLSSAGFVGENGRLDVIAFHAEVSEVYSKTGKPAQAALGEALAKIRAAGATNVVPPLEAAARLLTDGRAEVRSMIIMSDGFASEDDVTKPVQSLKAAGVKVSAVGIGDEVNVELLSRLAGETGGKWIHLSDASEMPRVVAQEARENMLGMFSSGTFPVSRSTAHPIVRDIRSVPGVRGLTRCRAKEGAMTALSSAKGGPVLAAWRVGSGKAAFVSVPLTEKHAPDWMTWNGLQALVEGVIGWTAGPAASSDTMNCRMENGGLTVELAHEAGDSAVLTARVDQGGAHAQADMQETRPGFWRARLDIGSPGIASVSAVENRNRNIATMVIAIPYSQELAGTGIDGAAVKRIASLTGGKVLRMGEAPALRPGADDTRSLRPVLVALAAACLVADVVAAWARSRRRWVAQESASGN